MESTNTVNIQNLTKILIKKELKIAAGAMPLKEGKIKPDPAKGEIKIFDQDGLLQFQWTNLDKNLSDDPLAIFSGEWEWGKIPSAKGRVYVLKSKCFEEEQFYFWLQSPNKDEDAEKELVINLLFDAGNFECLRKFVKSENNSDGNGGDNYNNNRQEKTDKSEITGFSGIENLNNSAGNLGNVNSASANANNVNNNNNIGQLGKAMTNEDFIKNIASTFKNIKRKLVYFFLCLN